MRAQEFAIKENTIRLSASDSTAAQDWIKKVYNKYPATWQNNHVMTWGSGDDQQFAMFELVPSFSQRGAVEVKWFQAYPLRAGVGTRAMRKLQAMAREDGISLTLYPWDKGQVSQPALTKFYRKQGFRPVNKGSKNLAWDHSVNEVAMNPSTFSAAVEQGQQQGVLVGFEFEVLVPAATLGKKAKESDLTHRKIQKIFDNTDYWIGLDIGTESDSGNITIQQFDSLFKVKSNAKTKHSSIQAAYDHMVTNTIGSIKQMFSQVPEDIRKKIVPLAKARLNKEFPGLADSAAGQIMFGKLFGRELYSYLRSQTRVPGRVRLVAISDSIRFKSLPQWDDLLSEYFKNTFYQENFSRLFDYDPQQVFTSLKLDSYADEDDEYDDYDYDYLGAAKILKPAVKQAFGRNVRVFTEYHEENKNLNDWYIEPDGSLTTDNSSDGAAEIVSPPMPAAEAMTALKNFYGLANQLNLYTNNTTGLHINVSIPGNLDILKLAMFLGDQYILQQFGRQNSSYAKSAEREIKAGAAERLTKTQNNGLNLKALERMAKEATSGHTASISNNGEYISFRHVGGNYLKDYAKIANAVGRFVRAMIIASTPSAYAKEYQTKLAKIQSSNAPIENDLVTMLRAKGTPVLNLSMWIKGRAQISTLIRSLNLRDYTITTTQPNSETAKNSIVDNMQDSGRKSDAAAAPVTQFVTMIAAPTNAASLQNALLPRNNKVKALYAGSGVSGYATTQMDNLPPTDPYTQNLLKSVLRQQLQPTTNTP
jgi:hypothetical protein